MKSIRIRLLIAAMAVLIGSTIARSQTAEAVSAPPVRAHAFGMGDGMRFFSKQLNLTDDQKTQMKSILQKEHPAMKPLMQQQRQIDQQLRQYVEGTFDQEKVQALATQKAQIQAQMTVQETRIHNQLYQVLTTDQREQLKQLEAQRQQRMEQRMKQASPAATEQE